MLLMTEEETRAILQERGWFYQERKRRSLGTKYVYARRRQGPKMIERYICPLSQLGELTEKKLVAKLAPIPEPTEKSTSAEREPEVSNTTDPLTHTDEL